MQFLWPRSPGYSSSFSGARSNDLKLQVSRSKVSLLIVQSQSSLPLWIVAALNGIFLLRSQIGKAFAAQISSFVE